jgi:hypothetical protein
MRRLPAGVITIAARRNAAPSLARSGRAAIDPRVQAMRLNTGH